MCTHQRQIYNRYTHQYMFVPCGHCKACQQKKAAARSRRIRAEYKVSSVCLSCTLTYDNWAVPYVLRDDINQTKEILEIFRDCEDYHSRFGSTYNQVVRRDKGQRVLDTVECLYDYNYDKPDACLRDLTKRKGRVGVLYYKDVQDFNKRLKQNLLRKYNYEGKYVFFAAGEYGHLQRPHFHLLVFCPVDYVDVFRSAIRSTWTFGDMLKERRVEVARDMAGYVASYVNRGSYFPPFLSRNFAPKTHFSQGFGTSSSVFQLSTILQKIDRGDLSYNIASSKSPTGFLSVLTPKYVINRYFPRFKGDFRLSCSEIRQFLSYLSPQYLASVKCKELDYDYHTIVTKPPLKASVIHFSEDVHKILVRQQHAIDYFVKMTGLTRFDYAIYWLRCWTVYKSNVLKFLHCSPDAPPVNERYDNLAELYHDGGVNGYAFGDLGFDFVEVNPNNFKSVIEQTQRLVNTFDSYQKYKDVNGAILCQVDNQF